MPERKIKEFDHMYTDISFSIERYLYLVAAAYLFSWKTPPHDITARIMNEIVELEKVEIK